jgi:D-glycero-D-manno-heptose 1,7-bisphosphate phosphatase
VEVFPEVPTILHAYRDAGWRIVGVSNQGGIALGHLTAGAYEAAMLQTNIRCIGAFDRMHWCPHFPSVESCWCRKPRIGMLVEAALSMAREHPGETYPPRLGLMVGDRDEDRACADAAGLRFLDAATWRSEVTRPIPTER